MTVGFVALWKNTDQEFRASRADELGTTEAIQEAFARGRARGTQTYGLFSCRFSSAWQYFTFWLAPSMDAVFDTIADLERAGDFKFADSRHAVGTLVSEAPNPNWDIVPDATLDDAPSLGVLTFSRGPAEQPHRAGQGLFPPEAMPGIREYGRFDCRLGSGWDHFSFAAAADLSSLTSLAHPPSTPGVEIERVVGKLDRFYRFASRLQQELTWLEGETPT